MKASKLFLRLVWTACALSVAALGAAMPARAQEVATLKVESAFSGGAEIDGEPIALIGEYLELPVGRHRLTLRGPYASALWVDFAVTPGDLKLEAVEPVQNCVEYPDESVASFQVTRWTAEVVRDPVHDHVPVILVHGPTLGRRDEPLLQCPLRCCGWDEHRNWNLSVRSDPQGAMVLAKGKYVTSTNKDISVPYGVMRAGGEEDVSVLVTRRSYIGCRYSLARLREAGVNAVECKLRRPD
ncbi:MAG: hypothetical protein AB1941_05435 [Gemmatimonadota bacterium]